MELLTVVLKDRVITPDAGTQTPGIIADRMLLKRSPAIGVKPVLLRIFPYFEITAIATHIWTVVIAFRYGGFLMGTASLILPGPAEVYWVFKLFGDQPIYAAVAILHLLLIIPMRQARKGIPY
jgi:hypothetical protein